MSIVKVSTLVVLTAFSSAAFAKPQFTAADDSFASELCVVAATGSKQQMRLKIQEFRPATIKLRSYKLIANKLHCNGENVVNFALMNANDAVASHLDRFRTGNVEIRDISQTFSGKVNIREDNMANASYTFKK
ncbi:MAG: DUF3718 domain-containing protein [Glaciecola sp.]|jgi:hypothetical protein